MNKFWVLTACCLGLWIHNWIQAQIKTTQKQIQEVYISEDWRDTLFLPVKNKWNNTQQETCENFSQNKYIKVNNDLPEKIENHEEFMTTNLFELEKIYSKQECLDLINRHFLLELNKYRESNWKAPLNIDERLKEFSQNRAQYLFDNSSLDHWEWADNLQNRLINAWIECTCWGENLCAWQMTTKKALDSLKESEDHDKLLQEESIESIWLWIIREEKWWVLYSTRVMTAIWNNPNN